MAALLQHKRFDSMPTLAGMHRGRFHTGEIIEYVSSDQV